MKLKSYASPFKVNKLFLLIKEQTEKLNVHLYHSENTK